MGLIWDKTAKIWSLFFHYNLYKSWLVHVDGLSWSVRGEIRGWEVNLHDKRARERVRRTYRGKAMMVCWFGGDEESLEGFFILCLFLISNYNVLTWWSETEISSSIFFFFRFFRYFRTIFLLDFALHSKNFTFSLIFLLLLELSATFSSRKVSEISSFVFDLSLSLTHSHSIFSFLNL